MTYDEAVTITGMVINAYPGDRDWNADQITMYAKGIQHLDAELTTRAVLQAQKTLARRPDVASLISITRSISAGNAAATVPTYSLPKPKPLPMWVKRWFVARYRTEPPDMRVFPEQREWSHPNAPMMPLDMYTDEAQRLGDREVVKAFGA